MTNAISQNMPITASTMQNVFKQKSLIRSIIDTICKFFTGCVTDTSIEKIKVQKELNDAIITAVREQQKNADTQGAGNPRWESLELLIRDTKITINNGMDSGVSIKVDGEYDEITIPTDLHVQDLINNAMMTNGGGEINTDSVHKPIGFVDLSLIEDESLNKYEENNTLVLQEKGLELEGATLFGTANGNVHLARVTVIESNDLTKALAQMRNIATSLKGDSENDHVILTVFGVQKLQSKLIDSDHYITAAVSSNKNEQPIIVDSKYFANYPEGIKVLRSGHQAALDTVSCGSHALRAMNGLAIQLAGNTKFSQLVPPPAFNENISSESIDINEMVTKIQKERIALEQSIVIDPSAVIVIGDDEEM